MTGTDSADLSVRRPKMNEESSILQKVKGCSQDLTFKDCAQVQTLSLCVCQTKDETLRRDTETDLSYVLSFVKELVTFGSI